MSVKEILVPNIGDFKNVEVIEVLISNGQNISKNDPLITIESDKSSVEVPSTENGKINSVKVKIGDKVSEGDIIATLETENKKENVKSVQKNLKEDFISTKVEEKEKIKIKEETYVRHNKIFASPKARKFARELGANISQIQGTERKGRITEGDIKNFVSNQLSASKDTDTKDQSSIKTKQEFKHSDFGEIEIKDIPRLKKLAAPHLVNSWRNIPHVTHHDEADITEIEEFRNSLTDVFTGEKKKITPLAFIIKGLVKTLKKFPNFNSSIEDINKGKMTLKKYYHIGVAVDTPHGLMVPKLRNVNNNNIDHISEELKIVSDKCRNMKIDKKEFFGGSMTVTSLGGIGGLFFTPIINYPEVAILGVGRSSKKNIYLENKYQTRTMLPLSLSYDHRIIDGAEAARFCNELKENLGKNFAYKLAV